AAAPPRSSSPTTSRTARRSPSPSTPRSTRARTRCGFIASTSGSARARSASTSGSPPRAQRRRRFSPNSPRPTPPPPPTPAPPRPRPRHIERLPYREYRSAAGEAIWVGRGAKDNDVLTFRHARGADLWLHCLDAAGAHVVVPLRAGKPVSEATFLDAATLAAHYSRLAGEAQVDVLYTHVKNLRRPKGAHPGRVFTSDRMTCLGVLES